jgi:AcrR family transcriptional regulator
MDRVGLDGLTIRAVAAEAGAPPMSLYTHFANKEELLDLMYAELSRRMYSDSGDPDWRLLLLSLACQVRQTLLAHPRWAALLARSAPATSLSVRERVLALMTDGGMSAAEALRCFSMVLTVAIGLSLVELTFRDPDGASSFSRRFERLRSWFEQYGPPGEPVSREAFAAAADLEPGDTFERAIRTLIAGSTLEPARPRAELRDST